MEVISSLLVLSLIIFLVKLIVLILVGLCLLWVKILNFFGLLGWFICLVLIEIMMYWVLNFFVVLWMKFGFFIVVVLMEILFVLVISSLWIFFMVCMLLFMVIGMK